MAEGLDFLIPSSLFMKGALIDHQRSSNKFAASGNRSALRLPGSFRRRGFQPDHFMETSLCGWAHSPRGTSCRPAHAAGGTLRQRGAFHAGCYAQSTLAQRAFLQMLYQHINCSFVCLSHYSCLCEQLLQCMFYYIEIRICRNQCQIRQKGGR